MPYIYFDNAATCGQIPDHIIEKVLPYLKGGINLSRGTYFLTKNAEQIVFNLRKFLSKYLNNGHIARLIFTHNCTEALNYIIFGSKSSGTEVVTTVTEHNSVLRPLYQLANAKNLKIKFAKPSGCGFVMAQDVVNLVTDKTAFVIMNACSNVTGKQNEFNLAAKLIGGKVPFFVDGAQAGGHIGFDMIGNNISAVTLAGHKGLFSLQGVGVLCLHKDFDLNPIMFGGSGSETFLKIPSAYPEKLEAGTLNLPAIISLYYGSMFALDNMEKHAGILLRLTDKVISGLNKLENIKIYSQKNLFGIAAFGVKNVDAQALSYILANKYGVIVRGGFHCAPLMHKQLKTADNGLIRLSFSPFNTEEEIDYFLKILPKAISDFFKA